MEQSDDLVTVIVCTRGRPRQLERCIASLERLEDPNHEILVVDNNDELSDGLERGSIRVVHEPRRGLDNARNRGIAEAKGGIVAFVDDDGEVAPGWLRGIRRGFEDPAVSIVTGRVLAGNVDADPARWFELITSFDRGPRRRRIEGRPGTSLVPTASARLGTGCNMAFRKELFDRIGGFDPALDMGTPVGGGGDLDILCRALDVGVEVSYEPSALIEHHHRETLGELRWQLFGYGVSVGALSWKYARRWRAKPLVRFQLRWHGWVLGVLGRRITGKNDVPVSLVLLQLLGNALGPAAYLWSSFRVWRTSR